MANQFSRLSQPSKKAAAVFAAAFLTIGFVPVSFAQPLNYDPALVDAGKKVYYVNCTKCHGLNMASTAAGFFDLRTFPPDDKPRFLESVRNGKRAMPAWKESLKAEEIEALWSYVRAGYKK